MPLGFPSLSHGTIAFGFFNIDTDLLLLEHYFIFAAEFCGHISDLAARKAEEPFQAIWDVFRIPRDDIGDLMGAIHGTRFSGFIGEVYRKFPFPARESDFAQKPEGFQTRAVVEGILQKFASGAAISVKAEKGGAGVAIGEFTFAPHAFRGLVNYVWLGGYPRWREGIRPEYVLNMKKAVEKSSSWLFEGPTFS
ncbi:MAG: hypothetical protein JW821_02720 [Deltaproteobacteria bacterium]|nr:hypothetical protein [Deltaproteobacteria bacterium]